MANDKSYFQLLFENRDYVPADRHFTSQDEIKQIDRHFGLTEMKRYDLQNLRDMAVLWYDAQMNDRSNPKFWDYMYAMQSVVAVIDNFLYKADN